MNLELNKIAKYLIGGILLFFVLKYTAQNKFRDLDIGLMALIAILIFMVIEYTQSLISSKSSNESSAAQCSSYCAMKEHLENTSQNTQVVKNTPAKEQSPEYAALRDAVDKLEKQRTLSNDKYIIESNKISRNADGTYTINLWRDPQAEHVGSRPENGVIQNETKYNYGDYNVIPPNLNEGTFESGYSFLPPSQWYPTSPFPPVCVAEKRCPVCPALTNKEYADLKEWDDSRRVYQPDGINTDYVKEKLNSGR